VVVRAFVRKVEWNLSLYAPVIVSTAMKTDAATRLEDLLR
jgi:hypothetical protein